MKKLKHILLRAASVATGNGPAQRALTFCVRLAHYLMGIGSGSSPDSSGERAVMRLVRERVAVPGRPLCVFDVGANRGQFLSVVLETVGVQKAEIHCFEPGRDAFGRLSQGFGNRAGIRLNHFGLADVAREAKLYYDAAGSGMSSTLQRDTEHLGVSFTGCESIKLSTLDAYCAAQGVTVIDLLKMDVEGAELSVLKGGEATFAAGKVRTVLFEFGGCNLDSRTFFRDFHHFFQRLGGRIFRITPSGYLVGIERYAESQEQFMTANFFVVLAPDVNV